MNNEIPQYRKNFTEIYRKQVVPALKPYEQERVSLKRKANKICFYTNIVFIPVIFFLTLLSKYSTLEALWYAFIFGTAPGLMVKYNFKKKFELKIKERIMPILMTAFDDMKWNSVCGISIDEICKSKLYAGAANMTNDDCFSTSYKGLPISITETNIKSTSLADKTCRDGTVFRGAVILIDIPKRFSGHTLIKSHNSGYKGPYKEVKLEDIEFSEKFYVNSTDQIEARYLLTPAFMQRFKNIQKAFRARRIECSFYDNKLLIAVSVFGDLFSLGNLDRTVIDPEQFTTLLNEIISIYEMIEELQLYQKIGM